MPPLKNPRQERFCLEYIATGNATQSAITAGYSPKTAKANASRMLTFAGVSARVDELKLALSEAKIADEIERREILSDIARGNLLDYQETGADGAWLNIGKDSPHTKAIAEIVSRTDEKNSVITKVKLHNPVPAIDLLNKMDKIYTDFPTGLQDNRTINIYISGGEEAKKNLEMLLEGKLRPQLKEGGNG